MKLTITILLIFFTQLFCLSQDINRQDKKLIRKEIKSMVKMDQRYRSEIFSSSNPDSLWLLQNSLDSVVKIKFESIINQYGYPSRKRVNGSEVTVALILHMTTQKDFDYLKTLFKSELENGNMPPKEYAWWYDRCQKNINKPIFYGQYTNEKFCGEQLGTFNLRRKNIGLEELEPDPSCE